jgi:hypothetical protein
MKNELDSLLKDAMREQHQRKKAQHKMKVETAVDTDLHSAYANPENWKHGSLVLLRHAGGVELGIFQEYLHIKSGARKLIPCLDLGGTRKVEVVSGDHWLGVRRGVQPDSPAGDDADVRRYLSRRTADEVKATLKSIDADAMLRELDEDF